MSSVQQGFGAALENEAAQVMEISEAYGPITIVVRNLDARDVVLSVSRKTTSALVALAQDTAVTNEDTGYDGDASTLVFTGQALNNVPIVPGSVTIAPTAGGNTVNATDLYGDGKLYTSDVDLDFCGTIDYFTGALELSYPTGKDPAATNILANYTYSEKTLASGIKTYQVNNLSPKDFESLIVKAAAKAGPARVRVVGFKTY